MNRKRLGLAAGAILFGALAFGGALAANHPATVVATNGVVQDRIIARGLVVPKAGVVEIRPRLDGRVIRVHVQEGDTVEAGQLLAELENDDLQAEVARRKSEGHALSLSARSIAGGARKEERIALEAELEAARQDLALRKDQSRRQEKLSAAGSSTEIDAEITKRALEIAKARVQAAEARVQLANAGGRAEDVQAMEARAEAALASVREAEATLARTRLTSPIRGVVLARRVDDGDSVSALANNTSAPLFELADTASNEVRLEVEDDDSSRVSKGLSVIFKSQGGRVVLGKGTVVRVGARLERRSIGVEDSRIRGDSQVRVLWADLVPEPGQVVSLGKRLEGEIALGNKEVAMLLPRKAVTILNGQALVVVPWGPVTRRVPVELGLADEANVEVLGLADGTRVIAQ